MFSGFSLQTKFIIALLLFLSYDHYEIVLFIFWCHFLNTYNNEIKKIINFAHMLTHQPDRVSFYFFSEVLLLAFFYYYHNIKHYQNCFIHRILWIFLENSLASALILRRISVANYLVDCRSR